MRKFSSLLALPIITLNLLIIPANVKAEETIQSNPQTITQDGIRYIQQPTQQFDTIIGSFKTDFQVEGLELVSIDYRYFNGIEMVFGTYNVSEDAQYDIVSTSKGSHIRSYMDLQNNFADYIKLVENKHHFVFTIGDNTLTVDSPFSTFVVTSFTAKRPCACGHTVELEYSFESQTGFEECGYDKETQHYANTFKTLTSLPTKEGIANWTGGSIK